VVGRAVPVPANGSIAPLAFGPGAMAGVRRALRRFRPDVIHAHEPLTLSLPLFATLTGEAPVVGTFHASAPRSAPYRVAAPALRRVARRLTVRTVVSDAARDLISRYIPGRYVLTPNGVDVSRFSGAEPAALSDKPVVLFLGRIERRKGLEILLQAMARLSDLDAELVVAGRGPRERSARSLARSLEVPARFIGRLSEDELPRVYRGAHLYCSPSIGGESFGIVLLEAMAAGAPVVCSDISGFRAVVGDGARLVAPGDAGELAGAIRHLVTDEEARARLGRAGRARAAMFDWSRLTAGVEDLYRRAAGDGA
jgi:phosphatidyl-myo-inositol alpha-mannosyltransferase